MRNIFYYNASFSDSAAYYPVNLYNLLIYNKFGYIGNSASTRNVQFRRTSDNDIQDFLFDKNKQSSIDAVNLWRGGSPIRLVRRYNEGVGGAAYDLFQNTAGSQPFIDTTTWEVDFSGGNYYLASLGNTSITDKNSIMISAFISQNTIENSGVFEEVIGSGNNRNVIYSDTRNTLFRAYNYSPSGTANPISFPTQQPTNTDKVIAARKVGNNVSVYGDNTLLSTINTSDTFSINTSLTEGRQLIGNLYFNGKSKGYIVHNTELTETILFELSTHLNA